MRSAKQIAKEFTADFQRVVHRFCPVPVRCNARVIKYRHSIAACLVGK